MKVTFTFEYADLLEHIEKLLAMNGVKPIVEEGVKLITFNHKKKEVVAQCEAAALPSTCPFCGVGVNQEAPTQDDPKENEVEQIPTANDGEPDSNVSEANEGEPGENVPMSLGALRARSSALASKDGPIKVQRGAEAHAKLAKPSLMAGESEEPPFPGEGGM